MLIGVVPDSWPLMKTCKAWPWESTVSVGTLFPCISHGFITTLEIQVRECKYKLQCRMYSNYYGFLSQ